MLRIYLSLRRGFTLIEILVVIGIIVILVSATIWQYRKWRDEYKFLEEISKLEYAIRWAKVKAVELYRFVKVDIQNGHYLVIYNCSFDTYCSSPVEIKRFYFENKLEKNNRIMFSPRGTVYGSNASICIIDEDNGRSVKIVINRFGIRREKGTC